MKVLFFFFSAIILNLNSLSQNKFNFPDSVKFISREDFKKYDSIVLEAAKWLDENDITTSIETRKQIAQFMGKYLVEIPDLNLVLNDQIATIYGRNYQLLANYLAGCARSYIEDENLPTDFAALKAGLISMIKCYKKGTGIKKSKEMEKLIQTYDKGQIDFYIHGVFGVY